MIDSSTEVIFLDEAYSSLLDIDDWKIICHGGFTSHGVKWKKAQGFHCGTSMYITCQQEMDFDEAHNDAMNRGSTSTSSKVCLALKWRLTSGFESTPWIALSGPKTWLSLAPPPH